MTQMTLPFVFQLWQADAHMETQEQDLTPEQMEALAFIRAQQVLFSDHGVLGMTRRQRARVDALDVVSVEERENAISMAWGLPMTLGPAPHGDTGMMRVVNWVTGEIREQKAPARSLDIDLGDELEAVAL